MPLPPKPPHLRQRRNRVSTNATLPASPRHVRAPTLAKDREWQRSTRQWWADVWRSPMATEFAATDRHALLRLAYLVDHFALSQGTDVKLASEIRQQEQRFGLTPLDRRRLQWTLPDAQSTPVAEATEPAPDPRRDFKVV